MTNQLTDRTGDQAIRAAFAQLRAAEQAQVVPPGVAAAQQWVRRRRHRRAVGAAAAGLAAVGLLGFGYLATGAGPELDHATGTGPAAEAGAVDPPAVDAAELSRLTELTEKAHGTEDAATLVDVFANEREDEDVAGASWPLPPGTYLLRVSCGGTGSVSLAVQVGEVEVLVTAQCGTTEEEIAAGTGEAELTVTDGDELLVSLAPVEQASTVLRVLSFSATPK